MVWCVVCSVVCSVELYNKIEGDKRMIIKVILTESTRNKKTDPPEGSYNGELWKFYWSGW